MGRALLKIAKFISLVVLIFVCAKFSSNFLIFLAILLPSYVLSVAFSVVAISLLCDVMHWEKSNIFEVKFDPKTSSHSVYRMGITNYSKEKIGEFLSKDAAFDRIEQERLKYRIKNV